MRKARRAAAATAAGTPLRLVDGEEEQEEADGQEDAAGVDGPAASGLPSRTARRRTAAAQVGGGWCLRGPLCCLQNMAASLAPGP